MTWALDFWLGCAAFALRAIGGGTGVEAPVRSSPAYASGGADEHWRDEMAVW